MLLILWLGVCHVFVVDLNICGSIILLDRRLCVSGMVVLLEVRHWSFLCVSKWFGVDRIITCLRRNTKL